PSKRTLFADLLGEIVASDEGPARFKRGVTQYPISGAPVVLATDADLTAIFGPVSRSNLRIGTLHHDARQPAFVLVNELLRKHFAVLGATGSGKSCAVSLLLSAILADYPMAHIILIDPHNEYGRAFGRTAGSGQYRQSPASVLAFRLRGGGRNTGPRRNRSGAGSAGTHP